MSKPHKSVAVAILTLLVCSGLANGDTLYKRARRVAIGDATKEKGVIYFRKCFSKEIPKQYKQPPYWIVREDNCREKQSGPWNEMGVPQLREIIGVVPSMIVNFFQDVFRTGSKQPLTLTVEPYVIQKGQSVTLRWICRYDDVQLELQPEVGQLEARSGTMSLSPGRSTSYALTADGSGGIARVKVHVTVRQK